MAVRADAAEAESAHRRPLRRLGPATTIAGVFFVLATAILYWPDDRIPYHVNEKAPTDLRSPVDLVVLDEVQTQRERERARANTGGVLTLDASALAQVRAHLENLREDVRQANNLSQVPPEIARRWPSLTPQALSWLRQVNPDVYRADVETLLGFLSRVPLIDDDSAAQLASQQSDLVFLSGVASSESRPTLQGEIVPVMRQNVFTLRSKDGARRQKLRDVVANIGAFPNAMTDVVVDYLLQSAPPTYRFDAVRQAQLAAEEAAKVKSAGLFIRKGEPIVTQGQVITPAIYQQLVLAQKQYEAQVLQRNPWIWRLAHAGQALSVLLLTIVGGLYVTQMNRSLSSARQGWSLVGLLLLTLFIAKGSVSLGLYHAVYVLGIAPALLTAVILVIAYNQRFAFVISSLHALLVTLVLGENIPFLLTNLAGITIFTFGLREIRTRGKLIEMGVFAGATLMVSVWVLGMGRLAASIWGFGTVPYVDLRAFMRALAVDSLWAAAAGVAVGVITQSFLPFIERVFKTTTALKMLELCDLNQPLLKRLNQEASGTFNHSLAVGTLAEAAGNAIGANGLLCRVGAYYHDIGKLSKPQYFIENQNGGPNRHEKLSPAMSLLIIVGHVKDGIELAREYKLPWIVHQFIAQHHGTTLVEYFYHAAKARAEGAAAKGEGMSVSEAEFRYAGPKPQTRETAILMICDGVESIMRSLSEPTPGRIETVVHQLVMKRLMDGQFSECDLTLRDLSRIEQSLVYMLVAAYHGRVAYPKPLTMQRPA